LGPPAPTKTFDRRVKRKFPARFGVNAIKLSRVGVQTFRFGRDWLRWDGVAKVEAVDSLGLDLTTFEKLSNLSTP